MLVILCFFLPPESQGILWSMNWDKIWFGIFRVFRASKETRVVRHATVCMVVFLFSTRTHEKYITKCFAFWEKNIFMKRKLNYWLCWACANMYRVVVTIIFFFLQYRGAYWHEFNKTGSWNCRTRMFSTMISVCRTSLNKRRTWFIYSLSNKPHSWSINCIFCYVKLCKTIWSTYYSMGL